MSWLSLGDLAALLSAIALLIGAIWQGAKSRAEIARILADMQADDGCSMREAVDRTDRRVHELAKSVGGLRDDMRQLRADVSQIYSGDTCQAHLYSALHRKHKDA